jgi:hypothetical protein
MVSAFKDDLLIDFAPRENDLQVKLDLDYNVRMAPREGKTSPMQGVSRSCRWIQWRRTGDIVDMPSSL